MSNIKPINNIINIDVIAVCLFLSDIEITSLYIYIVASKICNLSHKIYVIPNLWTCTYRGKLPISRNVLQFEIANKLGFVETSSHGHLSSCSHNLRISNIQAGLWGCVRSLARSPAWGIVSLARVGCGGGFGWRGMSLCICSARSHWPILTSPHRILRKGSVLWCVCGWVVGGWLCLRRGVQPQFVYTVHNM